MQQSPRQLVLEQLGVIGARKVAVVDAGLDVREHHTVDELLQPLLPLGGAHGATEVLRGHDRRGVDRPEVRELHVALFEDRGARLPVLLDDVAMFPGDLVVGVHTGGGEDAFDLHTLLAAAASRTCTRAGRLCH